MPIAIPTLGNSLFLTDASTKLTYLVRTYAIMPKSIGPVLRDSILSLGYQVAQFGTNPVGLCQKVQEDITTLCKTNFPEANPIVTVSHTDKPNGMYTVDISATLSINGDIIQADYHHTVSGNQILLPNDIVDFES